jgi:hypothetical protein
MSIAMMVAKTGIQFPYFSKIIAAIGGMHDILDRHLG